MKLSVIFGSALLTTQALTKPVVGPQIAQDVTPIWLSDKLLFPLLIGNAVQLILFLFKTILSSEKKRQEEILKAVSHIPQIMHKLDTLDSHVKTHVPTKDTVEVMIWRHMKDKSP